VEGWERGRAEWREAEREKVREGEKEGGRK
jgi:hypothetical protein